jgi:hypothetical protein
MTKRLEGPLFCGRGPLISLDPSKLSVEQLGKDVVKCQNKSGNGGICIPDCPARKKLKYLKSAQDEQ